MTLPISKKNRILTGNVKTYHVMPIQHLNKTHTDPQQ